jgi:hypothetical protein
MLSISWHSGPVSVREYPAECYHALFYSYHAPVSRLYLPSVPVFQVELFFCDSGAVCGEQFEVYRFSIPERVSFFKCDIFIIKTADYSKSASTSFT